MPEAEGRVETGAEGTPVVPFEERIKSLIEPSDEGKTADITNSSLIRLADLALKTRNQTPDRLADLLERGDGWFADGRVPKEEWSRLAGEIQAEIEKLRIKAAEGEPEIKKLERPKTAEEAVKVFLTEIFDLHERGLRESKSWEKTGELWSEFTTLQRWVGDVDRQWGDEFRKIGVNAELGEFLARQHPEGIRLREKLSLFLEAMKRLHNRETEVIRAEGGLEDLGVGKVGEAAAPILKTPLTNIRPIDWYLLTHVDELFPESTKPETKIDVEKAWIKWQAIGKQPYNERGKLKKIIKIGEFEYTLEDLFSSERVMREMRAKIAKDMGKEMGNDIAGTRAESLAHSILTVGLTLDMWDRERWKQKGKQDARDLMWFDWKRIERFCDLRPAGPWETVGCYWADELRIEKGFEPKALAMLNPGERKKREDYLKRNRRNALFVVKPTDFSEGTIIGDFLTSTIYKDDQKKPHRLSDAVSPKQIPWLDPRRFEEETYEGYFTYSLMFAAIMENNIKKLEWKPEELKNRDFWVGLTDTTLRLAHFCPWLIALVPPQELIKKFLLEKLPDDEKEKKEIEQEAYEKAGGFLAAGYILRFRQRLARGIFWTGSYLAQPNPESIFTVGVLSKEDIYGESFLGMKRAPGVLDAVESAGYLDSQSLGDLRREIYEFNFHLRGRKH